MAMHRGASLHTQGADRTACRRTPSKRQLPRARPCGEGDGRAAGIDAEAFGRDPQFAQFYRSLDAYKQSFNKKSDVLVLDPSSEFFRAMQGSGSTSNAPRR